MSANAGDQSQGSQTDCRGTAITVNRYLIQKDRAMEVVLYWYQQQGQAIGGEVPARIEMVRSSIVRNRTDGALVRVSMPVFGSVEGTTARLVQYVQTLYPASASTCHPEAVDE